MVNVQNIFLLNIMEYLAINNVYCFQKKKYKIINDKGAPILNLILINNYNYFNCSI